MWYWKCRECGRTFAESEKLPMKENPSGIMQEVCSYCYGALDLVPKQQSVQVDSEREKEQ